MLDRMRGVRSPVRASNRVGLLARRGVVPAAAAVLVLATPVATWWVVGDQSTVPVTADPDYAFRPWDISPAVARAAGFGSLALAIAAAVLLAWATARRQLAARWWAVLVPLVVVGVLAGAGWRVMTAGVIGVNIGAGFYLLFVVPLMGGLVLWALAASYYFLYRRDRASSPRGR